MAFDEALAARVRHLLARRKRVEEKKMFSGLGFLLNGNLLVGVRKDSLLVRLGPEQSDAALREDHVSEFRITGRGAMKGWVVVALAGVGGDDQLKDWIQRAAQFVATLPAK
jgi:TfoX/Sxy family transcriptional regulator of competence genes